MLLVEDQFKGTYSDIGSLKERLILNASGSIVSMGLSENILVYNEKKQLSQALERPIVAIHKESNKQINWRAMTDTWILRTFHK